MNAEQQKAYEWAKNQNYPSVAAQYAKTLTEAIDDLTEFADYKIKLCDQLTEQLSESQRREKAAAEDINFINSCRICKHGMRDGGLYFPHCDKYKAINTPHDCDNFEWRGIQEDTP